MDKLPGKPYCSNNLEKGLYPQFKETAINSKYIQMNTNNKKSIITLDIDHTNIQNPYWWKERSLPAPNYMTRNLTNGHAQVGFILISGVCTSVNGRYKPQNFYQNIQYGLNQIFEGDRNYRGFTGRNPLHTENNTIIHRSELYELQELSEYIPKESTKVKLVEYGEARNCIIFDSLRFWAYRNMNPQYKQNKSLWIDALEVKAIELNKQLSIPLWLPELKGIVKSVGTWTFKNTVTKEEYIKKTHNSELQNKRRLKGLKVRQGKAEEKRRLVYETYSMFPDSTYKELAGMMKVSTKTIQRYLKEFSMASEVDIYLNQDIGIPPLIKGRGELFNYP